MKTFKIIVFSAYLMNLAGCSQFLTHRDYLTEMEHDDSSYYNPQRDFPVMAGDTGRVWETEAERRQRTPASAQERQEDRTSYMLKQELKQLENRQSESAFEFYEQYRDRLTTVSERIYFLKLPMNERKEYLAYRGFLAPEKEKFTPDQHRYAHKQSSIILGMSKSDVMNNLGKPSRVEVAGNPTFENERWLYVVNGASKYIYFESGQVGGWE